MSDIIKTLNYGTLPIAKSNEYLKDEIIDTIEESLTLNFYEIRETLNGKLVAYLKQEKNIIKVDNMNIKQFEELFVNASLTKEEIEYLFFKDGSLAHTIKYYSKHPKAKTTEFYYNGNIYILN